MILERTGCSSLRILAPAKLNLFLEVLGKRPDGFHELSTIMHTISLFDSLEIECRGTSLDLEVEGKESGPVEKNLALQAARIFTQHGNQNRGFNIRLEKRIPVGGGLGGGSSDAAAVLLGLNELCDRPFSLEALKEMAGNLGSDVPFFLHGGTAR
ncbi:MAG: 4-(cytidine 5'-diphospho)-2-C-methyl-D-erythritol kinase, partial [Planctomycetes bacterium]|nr:4-(cytidine 5'-diphospho)-2-C-methyl-D-erythritol kinase [Planctomycetota bacterium]